MYCGEIKQPNDICVVSVDAFVCLSRCLSVCLFVCLYACLPVPVLLLAIQERSSPNFVQELTRFSRSWCHRSRSRSEAHGNLVNSIARESLNGFESKLRQILITVGRRTDYVFKVVRSKVKVTETFAGGGIQLSLIHI